MMEQAMPIKLPAGFEVRHPTTEHQPAIASLLNMCYQSLNDWANISSYEIARNWEFAGFNPQSDAWIILAPGTVSQGLLSARAGSTCASRHTAAAGG